MKNIQAERYVQPLDNPVEERLEYQQHVASQLRATSPFYVPPKEDPEHTLH